MAAAGASRPQKVVMTIEMELRGEEAEAARPPPAAAAARSPSRGSLKNALMSIIKPNAGT